MARTRESFSISLLLCLIVMAFFTTAGHAQNLKSDAARHRVSPAANGPLRSEHSCEAGGENWYSIAVEGPRSAWRNSRFRLVTLRRSSSPTCIRITWWEFQIYGSPAG